MEGGGKGDRTTSRKKEGQRETEAGRHGEKEMRRMGGEERTTYSSRRPTSNGLGAPWTRHPRGGINSEAADRAWSKRKQKKGAIAAQISTFGCSSLCAVNGEKENGGAGDGTTGAYCMLVTAEVFHPVMSMLNVVISRNSSVMFVTWLVSHDPMPTQSALENAGSSSAQALTLHASCSSQPVSAQPESPAGRDGQACARTSSARQQTTRCHTSERRVGRPRLLAESGRVLQGGSLADRPAGGKGRGG
eukprot:1609308-Rhodomonas_salina.1